MCQEEDLVYKELMPIMVTTVCNNNVSIASSNELLITCHRDLRHLIETNFVGRILEYCEFKRKIKISAEVSFSLCPSSAQLISEIAGRISLKLGSNLKMYSRLDFGYLWPYETLRYMTLNSNFINFLNSR